MKVPEIKISYSHRVPISQLPKIDSSRKAYDYAYPFFDKSQIELKESFWLFSLNNSCRMLGATLIGIGGSSSVIVDIKECLQIALKTNAKSVILMHNHPPGNISPSKSDIDMHNRIRNAFKLLEMEVLDSIIVSPEEGQYYSFADNGL